MRNEIMGKCKLSYTQKKADKPLNKHELATMIYGVIINKGEGIWLWNEAPNKRMQIPEKPKKPPCVECMQKGRYLYFVSKTAKVKVLNKSNQGF